MDKEFNFFEQGRYRANPELPSFIWHKIVKREGRIQKIKTAAFSLMGGLSAIMLFPVFSTLKESFLSSGFFDYLKLAFTSEIFSNYSKEMMYSLGESLPALNLTLALTVAFLFFLSLYLILKQFTRPAWNSRPGGNLSLTY